MDRSAHYIKSSLLDIRATDELGREFDVEVQILDSGSFISRSLFYWSQLYVNQLSKGDDYEELRPVVCINILDFTVFPEIEQAHNCFMVKHKDLVDVVLTEDLSIHFIELSKTVQGDDKLSDWIRFLQKEPEEATDMTVLIKRSQLFADVDKAFRRSTQDQEAREIALAREKFQRDEISRLRNAERKGKAKGKAEGKMEAAKEAARNLKNLGLAPDIIAAATGLTLAQIEAL